MTRAGSTFIKVPRPVPFLAGTKGVVETEHAGRQFFHRDTVLRAGIALAEHHRLAADDINNDQAVCLGQGGLNGICQTAADRIVDDQAVDHDLHRVLDVLFEADLLAQIVHVAVNAHTYKTGAAGGIQFLGLGAFAGTDYGASTWKRVRSGSFITSSTISSIDCW